MFRRNRFPIVVLWTGIATLAFSDTAMASIGPAYIGPGGGMEFFGYAMVLIGMLGAAFLSVILWPFYTVLGWLRGPKARAQAEQSTAAISTADASPTSLPLAPSDNGQATPSTPSVS